jgi:hypothetical protein
MDGFLKNKKIAKLSFCVVFVWIFSKKNIAKTKFGDIFFEKLLKN